MENNTYNEEVIFDRLVDGELTPTERRQLLASLDDRPEGWRRCAIAFLEAQSWRKDLGQIARGSQKETKELKSPTSADGRGTKSNWAAGAKWLALAASLLVAFELGSMRQGSGPESNQVAQVTSQASSPSPSGSKSKDELTLYVQDRNGRKQAVQVPLVDADQLDNQFGTQFQSGVPEDVRNQFKQHGYLVQSKRKYAPLWTDDNRPMVIPVEDTQIVPVSEKVWQ